MRHRRDYIRRRRVAYAVLALICIAVAWGVA